MTTAIFFSLICGLFLGFLFAQIFRRGKNTGPQAAPLPAGPKPDWTELHKEIDAFIDSAAQPSDLLNFEPFKKGAAYLSSPEVDMRELAQFWYGTRYTLAAVALHAAAHRNDPPEIYEALADRIQDIVATPLYFALQLLDQKGVTPLIPRVLCQVADWWSNHAIYSQIIGDFVALRLSRGEAIRQDLPPKYFKKILLPEMRLIAERFDKKIRQEVEALFDFWERSWVDLTFLKKIGRVWSLEETADTVVEHPAFQKALESLHETVLGESRRSVLLTGESGTGKTLLLRAFSRKLMEQGYVVVMSTATDLMAGQSYIGELEEQVQNLIKVLEPPRKVLWTCGHFEEFGLVGRHKYQNASILDQILPHMESGKLLLVGEITPSAYAQLIRQEPRLQLVAKKIELPALNDAESFSVVEKWSEQVVLSGPRLLGPGVLEEAQLLVKQYLPGKYGPGNLSDFLKQTVQRLLIHGALSRSIVMDDFLLTLSQLTGLPLSILDERQDMDVAGLRELFTRRVMGQEEAVRVLVDRIAMIKAGLVDPGRPAGVFFFVGPTGTGKTEIAKALAEFVYGSAERMIRYDMSEFQQPESIDRLLGSSKGDKNEEVLVHQIRKQPFSVILFDEFEKANPNIWDLFLQVFDDGRLTDRAGNVADFRHCMILLTSNAGANIEISRLGFKTEEAVLSRSHVHQVLEKTFRKEFLNRIDKMVLFQPLSREVMRRIIRKELDAVLQRRGLRQKNWLVEWDESAVEFLLEKGFTRDLGARPLRRAIEEHLLAPLAIRLVSADAPMGDQFLFVKRQDDALAVEFVSPEKNEEEAEPPRPSAEPDIRSLMLGAAGDDKEIDALESNQNALAAELSSRQWKEAHERALSQTGEPGFWNDASRFEKLGRAEYLFRIEEQILRLGKTIRHLRQGGEDEKKRSFKDRIAIAAGRAYLLREALAGYLEHEPSDAYLLLEASPEGDAEETTEFFTSLNSMYLEWAGLRRMKIKTLEEVLPDKNRTGLFFLSVSGFAAYRILKMEHGLHLFENPDLKQGTRRIRARVFCCPEIPGGPEKKAFTAEEVRAAGGDAAKIVRRYRRLPSPLVRDSVRGYRSGRLTEVLAGQFDVMK